MHPYLAQICLKRLYLPCNLALHIAHLLRVQVGGYYIAIIQTTYYPPTPLFHLALKWPTHGRIIRRQMLLPTELLSRGAIGILYIATKPAVAAHCESRENCSNEALVRLPELHPSAPSPCESRENCSNVATVNLPGLHPVVCL